MNEYITIRNIKGVLQLQIPISYSKLHLSLYYLKWMACFLFRLKHRYVIQLLSMSFYTKQLRWVDVGVVFSALIITKLVPFTSLVQEKWLEQMFNTILYFIDFSIFSAIIVAVQGKGGVAIFYFFRAGFALAAPDHSVSRSLLPAVVAYALLRTGEVVLDNQFLLSAKKNNNSSNEQREMLRNKQQKGKKFFLLLLGLILFIFTFLVTFQMDGWLPGLLLLAIIVSLTIELKKISSLQDYTSRLLQSSLHFNLYLYVILCWLLALKTSNSSIKYLKPAFIYLNMLLLYSRVFISRFTNKFHSTDGDLYYAAYPFGDHFYNVTLKYGDGKLRVAKSVDRISRQLGFLIYVLGVCLSSVDSNPLWISIGVITVNVYRIQNRESGWQAIIEDKLKIKLRLLLLAPLVVFSYGFYTEQYCRRQIIESIITNCGSSLQRLVTLCVAMSLVAIVSQAIKVRQYKILVQKAVAVMCPVVLLLFFMGLECQSLRTLLISLYSLGLCLSIIREDRQAVVKRGKSE